MCNCSSLEEIVNCGDNEFEEFIRPKGLRFLRERQDARLYVCPSCGTYWHIDHMQRSPQAIKVNEPFNWDSFDDLPYRRQFFERFHGIDPEQKCTWVGCSNAALKGMVFCVVHAYPELSSNAL